MKPAPNFIVTEVERLQNETRVAEGRAVNAEARAAAAEKRAAELTAAAEESALASMRFPVGVISEPHPATGNEIIHLMGMNVVVRLSEVAALLDGVPSWSQAADELDARGNDDAHCRTAVLSSGRFLIVLATDAEFARAQAQIGRK